MPIEIQQPGLAGLYGAAAVMSKREKEAQKAEEQRIRKEEIQMQQQYQQNVRQLDAQLDLEMYERSKRWEIDKMQLRSQMDFQREEQKRGRIIDDAENATLQIEKEIKAGNIDEDDPQVKNLLLYYSLQSQFPDRTPPTGLLKTPREEIDPMKQLIQRFLTGDEVEGVPGTDRVRVISPEGQTGTIAATEIEEFRAKGFTIIGETAPIKKPITKRTQPKLKPYGSVYREWL